MNRRPSLYARVRARTRSGRQNALRAQEFGYLLDASVRAGGNAKGGKGPNDCSVRSSIVPVIPYLLVAVGVAPEVVSIPLQP